MRPKLSLVVGLVLTILPVLLPPHSAHAADFNLTTSPLPIDLSTKPGTAIVTPLRFQNTSGQTAKVDITLKKFSANSDSGKPLILDPGPHDDFIHWVRFSQTSITAQPNVWYTVNMTITPPKDAAFGYYYAAIFSEESGNSSTNPQTHNKVSGAIASLVLLDVNAPGEKRQLSLTNFTSTKKLYDFLPANFNITIHNSGNVHAIPSGDIFISRDHKTSIATLDINPNQGNILPGTSRTYQVSWQDGFPLYQLKRTNGQIVSDSKSKPVQQLNWSGTNLSKLRFGRYYAHLTMTYNDGTKDIPIDQELAFWVVPWKLLFVLLIIGLLALAGLYGIGRSIWRKVKRWRKKS